MTKTSGTICIGSVLWDIIGRCALEMDRGHDRPGRITRLPGGVALNIAMALSRRGHRPVLLTAVGLDAEGTELVAACRRMGLDCDHVHRSNRPTDSYMAIEGENGLIAAIADAHSLEAAGAQILIPLRDGTLGSAEAPYDGLIALDGNLTEALLTEIAGDPAFRDADLRVAPASPGKALRLAPLVNAGRGTLYVNLEEAGLLCHTDFWRADDAARALVAAGAPRVLVTNGAEPAADACAAELHLKQPPRVQVRRVTGAGDTFMAAHMDAELRGADRDTALTAALRAAADYVSGEVGT